MCQNAFFPCLQETRMRRSEREKEDTTFGEKNSLLFLSFVKKFKCENKLFKNIFLKLSPSQEVYFFFK